MGLGGAFNCHRWGFCFFGRLFCDRAFSFCHSFSAVVFFILYCGFFSYKDRFFSKVFNSSFQIQKSASDKKISHFFLNWINGKYSLRIFGGALMGLCSGLTGLGGGVIISPLLHESLALPLKKISPSIALVTLFMSVFALSGQQWQGFSILENNSLKLAFPVLLLFAVLGAFFRSFISWQR